MNEIVSFCGYQIDIDHRREPPFMLNNSREEKRNSASRLIKYLNDNRDILSERDTLSKIAIVDD